ncbi:MAG: glycosyltransferase family 39 protein [Butyrivibrio sp.]|nr:glycosyltransferase family 39 protein [Muribaculum sp.]MCM1551348.1 glycosyltransferase family 39 protein [Butyrivibrio sp.]
MKPHTNTAKGVKLQSIYALCMGILFAFALCIALFLAYYSTCYSYYSSTNYDIPVYFTKDHVFFNILSFAAVIALSALLQLLFQELGDRLGEKKQRLAGYLFLGLCCLLYVTFCLVWVTELPYYPSGDQLNATAAAYYHRQGNFIMLKKSGYLGKFPYQKGLAFLYELLFDVFGDFCYPVAARFHIVMGVITMVFGYLFVEESVPDSFCKLLYGPLVLFCAPYLILTPYTYGDLPSICFCTVIFWALARFAKTDRLRYVILACCMAALSLMVRLHTWIALIAIIIGMLLVTIQRKKLRYLLSSLIITASALCAIKVLDYSFALRSGYEITEGAPMVLTLAMGLQDNNDGPGTYNNYQTTTLSSVDYDNDAATEIALEDIRENMESFTEDSSYAIWFFKTKLQMQWIEPSFETLKSTHSFDEALPVPDWIARVYYGDLHDPLVRFADGYQSVVYLGFLCSLFALWQRRKGDAASFIPLIAIVGGFLFSIIWESQCRYVLPYYLFMLMYVPEGIVLCHSMVRSLLQRMQRLLHRD